MNYIKCFDEKGNFIGEHYAPFNVKVDCLEINVYGEELSDMRLRGKCGSLVFMGIRDYKNDDLSGFMDLEIGTLVVGSKDNGLVKLLELNCKNIWCRDDKKLEDIMNKYLQEEPDPLMRDIQGCKYELAIKGYGDRL